MKEGLEALAWEARCDLVADNIPRTGDEIEDWILRKAASFGIEFLDGAARVMAEGLLATLDTQSEANDVSEACQRIPESGL